MKRKEDCISDYIRLEQSQNLSYTDLVYLKYDVLMYNFLLLMDEQF